MKPDARAKICRWFDGKQAALSLRFDDSHPTHVEHAVPMMNEYGLKGTFMINPARENHKKFKDAWEGSILAQGHELANHTMSHKGGLTDRDAEEEIRGCSEYIWGLQPGRLLAFARGGGTIWMQRKPAKYFLDRYALFRCGSSMSCSEVYPHFSVEGFKQRLERAIERGEWLETHFHCIGDGYLNISIPSFRKLLEYAKRDDVWNAGMATLHKYQAEREGARVLAHEVHGDAISLLLTCTTDPTLYDHPLTLEVAHPAGATVEILNAVGERVPHRISGNAVRFEVPPISATYTVRDSGLGKAVQVSNYPEPGPHPFLFFRREDIPALQKKAQQPVTDAIWARIKQAADVLTGADAPALPTGTPTWQEARNSAGRLWALGLSYVLTGDQIYPARAAKEIEVVLRAPSWTHEAIKSDADLVSAEITCDLAVAYDWMRDALPDDLKARMRDAIATRGLEPIARATAEGVWWTHWYRCNWGAVIYGQAGVAALCLLGEDARAADWVQLCQSKIWGYGRALGTDGSWGESVSYACYAWFNATLFMDVLHRLTGGVIDLFDNPRLRRFPEWFMHLMTPDESGFVPFSNCGKGTGFRGQFMYRLAQAYGDGHARWLADRMPGGGSLPGALGFLWYDPTIAPKTPEDLPTAQVFDHIDWAVLRSGWENPDAVLFALKGGQKEWDHYHHDTNHFVLYACGQPLIVDLFYPHKIWGCETEAHNTILINNRDQAGVVRVQGCRGKPNHRGAIGDLIDTPWYTRLVGDASAAYEPEDVRSFVREVLYLRHSGTDTPPDYFVIFDDVDATGPMPMDWLLHTYGDLAVKDNRITVVQGEAAADVTMVVPEVTHEVIVRDIEEAAGSVLPFEGAKNISFAKLRPAQPSARGNFVSVIAPRRASAAATLQISAVQEPNTCGAHIHSGPVEDIALFAIDAPDMYGAGISVRGRSCFVRKKDGKVVGAALHGGQKLAVDGVILFETDNCGHAVLTIGPKTIDVKLALYNQRTFWIHTGQRPSRVLVDGKDFAFDYEADKQRVKIDSSQARDVRVEF